MADTWPLPTNDGLTIACHLLISRAELAPSPGRFAPARRRPPRVASLLPADALPESLRSCPPKPPTPCARMCGCARLLIGLVATVTTLVVAPSAPTSAAPSTPSTAGRAAFARRTTWVSTPGSASSASRSSRRPASPLRRGGDPRRRRRAPGRGQGLAGVDAALGRPAHTSWLISADATLPVARAGEPHHRRLHARRPLHGHQGPAGRGAAEGDQRRDGRDDRVGHLRQPGPGVHRHSGRRRTSTRRSASRSTSTSPAPTRPRWSSPRPGCSPVPGPPTRRCPRTSWRRCWPRSPPRSPA